MNRSGLRWPAVGVVSLLLVVLGAHLAWEQHRYRLWTPSGTVRIGMTQAEVQEALGLPVSGGYCSRAKGLTCSWEGEVFVVYHDGRVVRAGGSDLGGELSFIPRRSLLGHVRSWFGGKGE